MGGEGWERRGRRGGREGEERSGCLVMRCGCCCLLLALVVGWLLAGWLVGWLAGWLVGWLFPNADQLHLFLALNGKEATRCCRYLNIRGSCRSSDDDVQPARLLQESWAQHRSSPLCTYLFLVSLRTPLTIAEGTLSTSAVATILRICQATLSLTLSCIRVLRGFF